MAERGIIIENAAVMTGGGPVHPDGYVHIRDGRIAEVGRMGRRVKAPGAVTIDAGGRYVLPGFINPHMHFYGALACGMDAGRMRSFGRVLERLWFRLDRALSLEDVRVSAMLGAAASLRAGVTTVFDHHASYGAIAGSLGAIARSVEDVGIRASLSFEISDRNGARARDAALEENASWLELVCARLSSDPRFALRGMVGLHASMTLSDESLMLARALMDIYGVPSHVHVAEGMEDVKRSRRKFGQRPAARLLRSGVLAEGSIAAHCVHVTPREMASLAKAGVCVAHNPLSNLNNAVGIAPVLEMVRRGVPVAVGTDGMSASPACDMRLASTIHRPSAGDAQAGLEELAYMAWAVAPWLASRSFGCEIGRIRRGAAADVIVVEARPATPLTRDNALGHLLFGVLGRPVRTAIVDGRVRMRDFRVPGVDEDALAAEARRRAKALWKRLK